MKILSLRLIVALIIGVTLVSLASSWYEVRTTKDALRRDLESKAETLGQSLAANAESSLQAGDTARLEQIIQRFTNRDLELNPAQNCLVANGLAQIAHRDHRAIVIC